MQIANTFLDSILENAPEVSNILSHKISRISYRNYTDFKIIHSETKQKISIPLTPDFAICKACTTEIRDPKNRRHGYAFTTCTNCGPRYAITTNFPFEREHTTMVSFQMCPTCAQEYTDPNNRRFHSQTNSCSNCGIQLKLTKANGDIINTDPSKIFSKVSNYLLAGNIIAIKNTNGYVLCCNANDKEAIKKLRKTKQRPSKPFALIYSSLKEIAKDFLISEEEKNALTSSVSPILILNPKRELQSLEQKFIAPGINRLGVMLPSSALLLILLDTIKIPIIATSGNIHGCPIISKESDAIKKLSEVADYFLHNDLEINFPQDDSVIQFVNKNQIVLRRSRGMAPNYMGKINVANEKILTMGAHLKSTFTFLPNKNIYVSPYFGNLDNFDVLERYHKSIIKYTHLFKTEPNTVVIDAHPSYQSTVLGEELAKKWNAKLIIVQHHKAHFASVLGENDLFNANEKILGIIWDGTGYGEDDAIWGGEFFSYEKNKMERVTHFEYIDWIAGDKMAKEPRLSLFSALPQNLRKSLDSKFTLPELKIYTKLISKNALKTSSVGRLFDAVASLLNITDINSYEGEAAMLLENCAALYKENEPIDFLSGVDFDVIPSRKIMENIYKAFESGESKPKLAYSFIHTLAMSIVKIAHKYKMHCIACSGGVFQNAILLEKLVLLSKKHGIKLKLNRILSSNDENISFGQLCYYQHIK